MEPTFATKPAFTVVGLKVRHQNDDPQQLPGLWQQVMPRADEVQHRAVPHEAFGVMGNYDAETQAFDYLAGLSVTQADDIPAGMERWDVPEQHYAVFKTTLPEIRSAYDFIYGQWMAQSGYKHAPGPEFELYDAQFEVDQTLYLYIPVEQ